MWKHLVTTSISALCAVAVAAAPAADALPSASTAVTTQARGNAPVTASQDQLPETVRLDGANRYGMAADVARSWPTGVDTVYVADGQTFPDALIAASRAGSRGAPLLITRPGSVPPETASALKHLAPARIVIVGNTTHVSSAVARTLARYATSGSVTRVAGTSANRVSAQMSRYYPTRLDTAYLASSEVYPDALAGAALAGQEGMPLLLTSKKALDGSVIDALDRLSPREVVVLGGPATVSDSVLKELRKLGAPVTRVAGLDRYDTATAIAERVPTSSRTAYVASGQNFPDALVGAAAAARDKAPVLLTRAGSVPTATGKALTTRTPRSLFILGGPVMIYSSTMASLARYSAPSQGTEVFTPLQSSLDFAWSGQQWRAKEVASQGPGPNRWHRTGVQLGNKGSLKLTVAKNASGQWTSSEVVRQGTTGYGTYSFTTTSSVVPPNDRSVLGLFSYQHNTPSEGYEEIDIEYSRWLKPSTGPGTITVHKPHPPWVREFNVDYTGPMTHTFLWAPGYVRWRIVRNDTGAILHERSLWGADVPKYADARMHMNLWLIDGVAAPSQKPFDVTFSAASWAPLPAGFTVPAQAASLMTTADLHDSFAGGLDTSRWPGRFQYGRPTTDQGHLDIPLGPGFHGIQSTPEYRLADSSISVEQTRPRRVHANSESEVAFVADGDNSVTLITVGDSTGRTQVTTNGTHRSVDFAYDRVDHRWLRIRASAKTLHFEASPDGRTWSRVVPDQSLPAWLTSRRGQIKLGGGNYSVDDPAGSVQFDNLNRTR